MFNSCRFYSIEHVKIQMLWNLLISDSVEHVQFLQMAQILFVVTKIKEWKERAVLVDLCIFICFCAYESDSI
jgi:hypothetical protein